MEECEVCGEDHPEFEDEDEAHNNPLCLMDTDARNIVEEIDFALGEAFALSVDYHGDNEIELKYELLVMISDAEDIPEYHSDEFNDHSEDWYDYCVTFFDRIESVISYMGYIPYRNSDAASWVIYPPNEKREREQKNESHN